MLLTTEQVEEILALVKRASEEHAVDMSECDVCGMHYHCSSESCRSQGEWGLDGSHTTQMVGEALAYHLRGIK